MIGRRRVLVVGIAGLAMTLGGVAPAAGYLRDFERKRDVIDASPGFNKGTTGGFCSSAQRTLGVGAGLPGAYAPGLAFGQLWIYAVNGVPLRAVSIYAYETDPVTRAWAMVSEADCVTETLVAPTAATGAPYIKDVKVILAKSAFNSTPLRGTAAHCPAGYHAIGGGFAITGSPYGFPHRSVHQALNFGDGFIAGAHEVEPHGLDWGLDAQAICADLTRAQTGPVYIGNDLIFPVVTSPATSLPKGVTVSCGPRRQIIGGAASIIPAGETGAAPTEVVLTASRPLTSANHGWYASAFEEDPTSEPWRIQGRAICGRVVPPS